MDVSFVFARVANDYTGLIHVLAKFDNANCSPGSTVYRKCCNASEMQVLASVEDLPECPGCMEAWSRMLACPVDEGRFSVVPGDD